MYFPTSFADDLKKKTFKKLELFERNVYQNPKPSKSMLRFHVLGNLQHIIKYKQMEYFQATSRTR